jgi:ubiquinone/menaquinone biosynthesis C-methylase UbiE
MRYNIYSDGTTYNPEEDYPFMLNFRAKKENADMAKQLMIKFNELGPHPSRELAEPIVKELIAIREKSYEEKSDLEKWTQCAAQMPGDIGGAIRADLKEIMTSKARGNVLEAMCGFNSYFNDSPWIAQITALDYCREMLEKYENPERTRILFDINSISDGEKMKFFKKGEFDTIGISYGTNYLTEMLPVFNEFNRILSTGGKLLILENTTAGYDAIVKRRFNPKQTAAEMRKAGFITKENKLDIKDGYLGTYYILEGMKKNSDKT